MAIAGEKKRHMVTLSKELAEYYEKQAEEYGISISSVMAMALAQYKQSMEGINAIKDFTVLMDKFNDMKSSMTSPKDKDAEILTFDEYLKR